MQPLWVGIGLLAAVLLARDLMRTRGVPADWRPEGSLISRMTRDVYRAWLVLWFVIVLVFVGINASNVAAS